MNLHPAASAWRVSGPSTFALHYTAPSLTAVTSPSGAAPAAGGFTLRLLGTDFSAGVPGVTVGALPCVVLPVDGSHEGLSCTAPALQVDVGSEVQVEVDGQRSLPVSFTYDGPRVTELVPPFVDAVSGPGVTTARRQVGGAVSVPMLQANPYTLPCACQVYVRWCGTTVHCTRACRCVPTLNAKRLPAVYLSPSDPTPPRRCPSMASTLVCGTRWAWRVGTQ